MSEDWTVKVFGHSLIYVTRDGKDHFNLLKEPATKLYRPERDVLIALLRWALEELEKGPIP